jgi:uncharacterized protein YxjI
LSLLDPSNDYYVLHEKTWKFGGGDIYNTDGERIGIMKRKMISMRDEIQLLNQDETEVCTINKKLMSARPIYDVKTPDGVLIGRAKRPMIALRGSIDWYDAEDNILLKAQGGIKKWDFRITDPKDKKLIYAEIKKGDRWRDVFAPMFDFKDRYVIHITDPNIPRVMLLAYAVIIDNVYHDK